MLFYKVWWEPVSSLVPSWMAPNLVTFIGFVVAMTNIPLFVYFNPTLETTVPSWVFAYAGFTVFFYLTMDAIDGMQARKTKSSSPLGQLFDHGCDCAITTVFSLLMVNGLGLGADWRSVALVCSVQVAFFLSQWEEKYTGTCRTSVAGIFGVTETQLMLMTQMFVSAYNPNIGATVIVEGWTFANTYVAVYVGFMALVSVICVAGIVFKHPGSLLELISIIALNSAVFCWSVVFEMRPDEYVMALLALAFCNSFSTIRVIVSSITHGSFPTYQPVTFPFFLLMAARFISGYSYAGKLALAFYLGGLMDHIVKTLVKIVNEISSYLGIYVFDIISKRK